MDNMKLGDMSKIGILDPTGKPHRQLEKGIRDVQGHDNEADQ
jgi:hypothetical protein